MGGTVPQRQRAVGAGRGEPRRPLGGLHLVGGRSPAAAASRSPVGLAGRAVRRQQPRPARLRLRPGWLDRPAAVRRQQRPALPAVEVLRRSRFGSHQDQVPCPQRRRPVVRPRLVARRASSRPSCRGTATASRTPRWSSTPAPTGSSTRATSGSRPTTAWARPPAPARSGRAAAPADSPLISNTATEWSPGGGTLFTDTSRPAPDHLPGLERALHELPDQPELRPDRALCEPGPALLPHRRRGRRRRAPDRRPHRGARPWRPSAATPSTSRDGASTRPTPSSIRSTSTSTASPCPSSPTSRGPTSVPAFPGLGSAHGFSAVVGAGSRHPPGVCLRDRRGHARQQRPRLPDGRRARLRAHRQPRGGHRPAWARSRSRAGRSTPTPPSPVTVHLFVDGVATAVVADRRPPRRRRRLPGQGPAPRVRRHDPGGRRAPSGVRLRLNVGPGTNKYLGCRTVVVPGGTPIGSLENATGRERWGRGRRLGPRPRHSCGRSRSTCTSTGSESPPPPSQSRPDVGSVFPLYGPAHGFTATVPAAPGGAHRVRLRHQRGHRLGRTACSAAARWSSPTRALREPGVGPRPGRARSR